MAKRNVGRYVIDALRSAYKDGLVLERIWDVYRYIEDEIGITPTVGQARGWDHQARLENSDEGYANTQPVRRFGYRRDPNASAEVREQSYTPEVKYNATRVGNARRKLRAAANQPDATRVEIQRDVLYEEATRMLQRAKELS